MKMLRILPAALAILFVSGCNKLVDHIKDHLDGDDKTYRIEKLVIYPQASIPYVGVFAYNENNDPVSVIFDSLKYNVINWRFIYDKHKRMIESQQFRGDEYFKPLFEEIRKYKYNNKGQIVSDTAYLHGRWENPPTPENTYYSTGSYEYDSKGRLVKYIEEYPDLGPCCSGNIVTHEYVYDANGNLVRPGGYVYDNKLSFKRTNKIWMFVNRDYSVSNILPAVSYNSRGLPLVFDYELTQPAWTYPAFLGNDFHSSIFTYKKLN